MTHRNELEQLITALAAMGVTCTTHTDPKTGYIDEISCSAIANGKPLSPLSFAERARPIVARRRREA